MSAAVLWPFRPNDPRARMCFTCPGCEQDHVVSTAGPTAWGFNGDMARPTFSPSILVRCTHGPEHTPFVCHSFVRDGQIEFLTDCTHALAGKTVPLNPVT